MIAEVYIATEVGGPSNEAIVVIDNGTFLHPLTAPEQILLAAAITEMQATDATNFGFLIETDKIKDYISLSFVSAVIDPAVTNCDKGALVDDSLALFANLNALVVSILDTLIP